MKRGICFAAGFLSAHETALLAYSLLGPDAKRALQTGAAVPLAAASGAALIVYCCLPLV